ncbi:nuclear transport factor 2 family protein [Streptococcus sp. sy018]|uniref:nuclear transport factor 2 family protein n=1 Tax=Streptococcus sp. sy018 TaxID=2600147 RepID=UPI0011B7C5AD|nr:nuclear transport factor 2 family protein [Streptococcus sp. sy018]TWS94818.1 nuclear transport factor 2 family protein [Streptococcus sp. sy018]
MDEKEILKTLYREMNQAMVSKNIEKLESILQPHTDLVHMTGYVQPVSEWLEDIASERMKYYTWQEENIKDVEIHGMKASLVGQSKVRARIWGAGPSIWPLQMLVSFEKIDGQWKIVKQEASTY